MQRAFIKKCFLFMLGSVCRFETESRISLQDVGKSQIMADQVLKFLRQQSKDMHAAGFDELVK
jgi:hypothetical protein